MKPAPFKYFAPTTLEEALSHLTEYGDEAKILAGGQSLVPTMNFRLAQPAVLIDLNRVEELFYIKTENSAGLKIGAMTRQQEVERSKLILEKAPLIHETMHLQLSLVERVVPLVRADHSNRLTYSPWKSEHRPAGGILHALYVFRVIERFWSTCVRHADDSCVTGFAETRIAEITTDIEQIGEFRSHPALTNEGREVVRALLK